MKKIVILGLFFILGALGLYSCEIEFNLFDSNGEEVRVDRVTELESGEKYSLQLSYYEDHRNCKVRPEDTLFFIDGSIFRVLKETQALVLQKDILWNKEGTRGWEAEIDFIPNKLGETSLNIIRECSKGGCDGTLNFLVVEG